MNTIRLLRSIHLNSSHEWFSCRSVYYQKDCCCRSWHPACPFAAGASVVGLLMLWQILLHRGTVYAIPYFDTASLLHNETIWAHREPPVFNEAAPPMRPPGVSVKLDLVKLCIRAVFKSESVKRSNLQWSTCFAHGLHGSSTCVSSVFFASSLPWCSFILLRVAVHFHLPVVSLPCFGDQRYLSLHLVWSSFKLQRATGYPLQLLRSILKLNYR